MSAAASRLEGAASYFKLLQGLQGLPDRLRPGFTSRTDDDSLEWDFQGARLLVERAFPGDDEQRHGFTDAMAWHLIQEVNGLSPRFSDDVNENARLALRRVCGPGESGDGPLRPAVAVATPASARLNVVRSMLRVWLKSMPEENGFETPAAASPAQVALRAVSEILVTIDEPEGLAIIFARGLVDTAEAALWKFCQGDSGFGATPRDCWFRVPGYLQVFRQPSGRFRAELVVSYEEQERRQRAQRAAEQRERDDDQALTAKIDNQLEQQLRGRAAEHYLRTGHLPEWAPGPSDAVKAIRQTGHLRLVSVPADASTIDTRKPTSPCSPELERAIAQAWAAVGQAEPKPPRQSLSLVWSAP